MKKWSFPLFLLVSTLLSACFKDDVTKTYTILEPVYKDKVEVFANISSNAPRAVESPGKMFLHGNYIFLNEQDKGIHVIDNSDPAHPVNKSFIDIPGNLDIAVKGNTLYADLYADLVTVDISNPMQVQFRKYTSAVFPERAYQNGFIGDSSRVIVEWKKRDTTVKINSNWRCRGCIYYDMLASSFMPSAAAAAAPGLSGSMARFSLVGDYLYAVNYSSLKVFDVAIPGEAQYKGMTQVGWDIETIYPFQNKLFIGSRSGMFIYDISNPVAPSMHGQFTHARACDPVIADANYAYVTLRDGTACNGFVNQLDVVDVRNAMAPSLVKSYTLTNPHGLSKDGDLLFVCDGRDGIKVYDASNPANLSLKKHLSGLETYDAIAWQNNLVVSAKDGLYQYRYDASGEAQLRSKITVNR